jgi:hypothetical protein
VPEFLADAGWKQVVGMDHRMDERASFAAIQQALGHFLRWQEQQKRRAVEDMASQVGSNSDWDAQSNVSVAETDGDVLGDMKLSKDGGLRRGTSASEEFKRPSH